MVKNFISFFIAIDVLLFQFLDFVVDLLQLLQPESHTINTGFIKSFIIKLSLDGTLKMPKL